MVLSLGLSSRVVTTHGTISLIASFIGGMLIVIFIRVSCLAQRLRVMRVDFLRCVSVAPWQAVCNITEINSICTLTMSRAVPICIQTEPDVMD